jgi:DNA (cytosine-5)-methyltransferase 1
MLQRKAAWQWPPFAFPPVLDCEEGNLGLTHGSLFSGIGGIDLGLEWAGFETAWQVEIDPFCNRVLEDRWPNVPRFPDVRAVGKHNLKQVSIISGGFPCQDISVAAGGKERGLHRERSGLWFEYARIVRELQPDWVLVENVPNLRDHGADTVISDLEGAGYSCWPTVVGVDAFQAPFQRRRAFILACHNSHCDGDLGDGLADGWALPPDVERQVAQACQDWRHWQHELGAGNARPVGGAGESEPAAYARGVRAVYGIPDWVDRLKACGNACTPVIPALIGSFVANFERLRISR